MSTIPEITEHAIRHGYNPIPPEDPNVPFTDEDVHRIKLHDAFQRARLGGFTISQLQDFGCWDKPDALPSDLDSSNTPIHPLYQRRLWKSGSIPINYLGIPGNWEAANDVVWDAIVPCLRIATRLLDNSYVWPWLDTLINGEYRPIPPEEIDDGYPATGRLSEPRSFHCRSPAQAAMDIETKKTLIHELQHHLAIEIDVIINQFVTMAHCRPRDWRHDPQIGSFTLMVINNDTLRPLLRPDLSTSERLVHQLMVANVFLHETMHALSYFIDFKRTINAGVRQYGALQEGFFEDEAIMELGWSWETATFGGTVDPGYQAESPVVNQTMRNSGEPSQYLLVQDWPSWEFYLDGKWRPGTNIRFRKTTIYQDGAQLDRWPMPIRLVENLQQATYWKNVAKFGLVALRTPRVVSLRSVRGGVMCLLVGSDYEAWVDEGGRPLAGPLLPQSPTEEQIWEFEQQRATRASVVNVWTQLDKERRLEEIRARTYPPEARAARLQQLEAILADDRVAIRAAIDAYDPNQPDRCLQLLAPLANSVIHVTRANYFTYMSIVATGVDADWRSRQLQLGYQESMVINDEEKDAIRNNMTTLRERQLRALQVPAQPGGIKRGRDDDSDEDTDDTNGSRRRRSKRQRT